MDPETLAAAAARTLARDEAEAVAATVGIRHTRAHAADDPALARTVAASLSDGPRTVDPRSLPSIAIAEGDAADTADLTLGRVLGEGGMGIVVLARQRSLQRDVALKRVRRAGTNQAEALLREAAFSGYLEHPNIVPVHALGRDSDGSPVLVMKRIEGTTLATLFHEPSHPAWERAGDDRLGFVLRALRDVCDALSYAHARGVLHRDVKPENVMLGAFGEVYLLDWGVAVRKVDALTDDAVVGTPVYMAPEMLAPGTHPLDERTDVYLVGAMLHEHLTGHPPHEGRSMAEVLLSVARAAVPTYPSHVPEELADIARRALHADRDQRFPSAEALGRALSEFDRHRAAAALAQAALARLSELEAAIARGARPDETEPLFHECRFGFEQALRSWPENARARADLRRALVRMIGHHLDLDNRAAAAALLASLDAPPPDLVARLAALDAAADHDRVERARLRRLAHDLDPSVAEPQRRQAVRAVGVLLFAFALALSVSYALGRFVPNTRVMALIMIPGFLIVLVVGVRHRHTFTKNRLNRQMLLTVITAVVAIGTNRALGAVHQRLRRRGLGGRPVDRRARLRRGDLVPPGVPRGDGAVPRGRDRRSVPGHARLRAVADSGHHVGGARRQDAGVPPPASARPSGRTLTCAPPLGPMRAMAEQPRVSLVCPECGAPLPKEAATRAATCDRCGHTSVPAPLRAAAAARPTVPAPGERPDRPCPRCAVPLFSTSVQGIELFGCGDCGGLFLDNEAGARVVKGRDREIERLARMAAEHARRDVPVDAPDLPCPVCAAAMRRARVRGQVDVDLCDPHGTWFDRGELDRIVRTPTVVDADALERARAEARMAAFRVAQSEAIDGASTRAEVGALAATAGLLGVLAGLVAGSK